ncbi:MAG: B3/B4 domain-containing protein [Candidatus Asgardarchaeia archaeon]
MITWSDMVKRRIPIFYVTTVIIRNVKVEKEEADIFNELFVKVKEKITKKETLTTLKDNQVIRLYRDFYWKYLSIDPTKIRPSGEALARRILQGKKIPRIFNVVDAYNLASAETFVSFGAYDLDRIKFPLIFDLAKEGEPFYGIGMDKPKILSGKEIVLRDSDGIVNVYPYRDSERTKVREDTKNILIIGAGVPRLSKMTLIEATKKVVEYIKILASGTAEEIIVHPRNNKV